MEYGDIYWRSIFYVVPILEILIGGYCFNRFAEPFYTMLHKENNYKIKNRIGIFCVGTAYSLIMIMLYIIPLHIDTFIAFSIGVLSAFGVMCVCESRNYRQKAFIGVTFFALRWFSSAMAEILYDNLYNFALNTDYMKAHQDMSFALYVGVCVFYLVCEFLFIDISIRCILRSYKCKYKGMSGKEFMVLVIPAFMGVAGYEIIWCYRNFYIAKMGNNSNMYDILSLLYYAAAIITIVVVIVLYQSIKAGQEEKLQAELLSAQVEGIRKHVEQVESMYQDIRSIKHDMTNHIITLERLYAGNKAEEAIKYSTNLKKAITESQGEIISGNPVTDVILQEMKSKAEKEKIGFDVKFHYPTDSDVNAFDISVILNNALQNALENAVKSEKPYISVLSYRRKNAYIIEINNSFTGDLKYDIESGLPITLKDEADCFKQGHGYGLLNIKRIAEKYSGDIVIDLKDGEFCLSILLMMEL